MKKAFSLILVLTLLLGFAACGDDDEATSASEESATQLDWDYLTELPDGFPKLSEYVTTTQETYSEGKSTCAIYWAVLDESTYKSYLTSIEKWAGTSFGDGEANGTVTLTTDKGDEKITVKAAYNGSASGNFLEGGNYDSQARIEVITERAAN